MKAADANWYAPKNGPNGGQQADAKKPIKNSHPVHGSLRMAPLASGTVL
jgi:hypothetical protein